MTSLCCVAGRFLERCVSTVGLLLLVCSPVNGPWRELSSGDFSVVEKGSYRGFPQYLAQPGGYEVRVRELRRQVEDNRELLPRITRQFYDLPETTEFHYKFASVDTINRCLILRYFGPVFSDRLLAGYQIQFVFNLGGGRLVKIYTSEVPLE